MLIAELLTVDGKARIIKDAEMKVIILIFFGLEAFQGRMGELETDQ